MPVAGSRHVLAAPLVTRGSSGVAAHAAAPETEEIALLERALALAKERRAKAKEAPPARAAGSGDYTGAGALHRSPGNRGAPLGGGKAAGARGSSGLA